MTTYHLRIKSGKKGSANVHARYITRRKKRHSCAASSDLIYAEHGNLPAFCRNDPLKLFKNADKHERVNGAAYREYELALPNELTKKEYIDMVNAFITAEIGNKAYLVALHEPIASLGGVKQPHAHLMYCDRKPDGIERDEKQFFKRYNPSSPELGGAKKDRSGKNPAELREQIIATRALWADIQNEYLTKAGHTAKADHRSLADRGIARKPERHLGRVTINLMSEVDKYTYLKGRSNDDLDNKEEPLEDNGPE